MSTVNGQVLRGCALGAACGMLLVSAVSMAACGSVHSSVHCVCCVGDVCAPLCESLLCVRVCDACETLSFTAWAMPFERKHGAAADRQLASTGEAVVGVGDGVAVDDWRELFVRPAAASPRPSRPGGAEL